MKRTFLMMLAVVLLVSAVPANAAQRIVFFEHFSQELCSTCPITAAAATDFRNAFGYDQVAMVSYWTQGSAAIPDGNNRGLEFYDEVLTPSVICDGLNDIPAPPQEYDDFVNAYNARAGVPAPCTMAVIDNGGGSYTIQIVAEEAFSGSLVAVAYEPFNDSHGATYATFGRQFLTNYGGESISASAGQTIDFPVNATVGHSGVVAWIHNDGKAIGGSRRFTPWEVMQAADSNAGPPPVTPTPTPTSGGDTPTPTPTLPPGTPTATPDIPCNDLAAIIDMPSDFFRGGDDFYLDVYCCNPEGVEYERPLFVLMDILGTFYFAPSFNIVFDKYDMVLPPNELTLQTVLPLFTWPSGAGDVSGIVIYAAMTNPEMNALFGDMDMVTFGWTN